MASPSLRSRLAVSTFALFSVPLAGCGGGGEDPVSTAPGASFAAATASAAEDAGSIAVSLQVPAGLNQDVTLGLTASGTASAPADFTLASDSLLIPAGALSAEAVINLIDDSLFEADETIELTITSVSPAGAVPIGSVGTFVLIVTNDDAAPAVEFLTTVAEVDETQDELRLPIGLSEVSGLDATVLITTLGTGGAEDFTLVDPAVTIPAGSLEGEVVLVPIQDNMLEGEESFELTLVSPVGATLGAEVAASVTLTELTPFGNFGDVLFSTASPDGGNAPMFTSALLSDTFVPLSAPESVALSFVVSPSRNRLAFFGTNSDPVDLGWFVLESGSTEVVQLSQGVALSPGPIRWSADDQFLVFKTGGFASPLSRLVVCRADGSECVDMLPAGASLAPNQSEFAFSPVGQRVAFLANSSVLGPQRLFTSNPDGTDLVDVTSGVPSSFVTETFKWSPDGERLAFVYDQSLYVARADGTGLFLVTEQFQDNPTPAENFGWNPTSGWLTYQVRESSDLPAELFSVAPEGGSAPVRLSFQTANVGLGWTWSPDGSQIAYQTNEIDGQSRRAYVVKADGTETTQVSQALSILTNVYELIWAPDSSRLGLHAFGDLFSVASDGSDLALLSQTSTITDSVDRGTWSFSPDSSRIAYIATREELSHEEILASNAAAGGDLRLHAPPFLLPSDSKELDAKWTADSSGLVFLVQSPFGDEGLAAVGIEEGDEIEVLNPSGAPTASFGVVQFEVR